MNENIKEMEGCYNLEYEKNLPCLCIGRNNTIKIAITSKEPCKLNAIPKKIPVESLTELESKQTIQFNYKQKKPQNLPKLSRARKPMVNA